MPSSNYIDTANRLTPGTLYVVATPIGNLADISQRAIDVLQTVALVAAEDTRHSGQLFQSLGINNRLLSFHDFSSGTRQAQLLTRLQQGDSIALISDAGTPAISDPGFELVRLARQHGVPVIAVPGPSALTAALSIAGIATDRFVFEGFLPARSHGRRERLAALKNETRTLVLFESPHRILDSLQDMAAMFGTDREIYLGRELTKRFETSLRGSIGECIEILRQDPQQRKGEFVLILAGQPDTESRQQELTEGLRVLRILMEELPHNQAAQLAARISGAPRNQLYQAGLQAGLDSGSSADSET